MNNLDEQIKVCEIFNGIQGEGLYTGQNSIFIRLSGCNLNCSFCDSQYHKEGIMMSLEQITREVQKYQTNNIVITGGEPMLWQRQLILLFKYLSGYTITIETNGTIMPIEEMKFNVDLWSVSPKLQSSGNKNAINDIILQELYSINSIYKFVITDERDLEQVLGILKVNNIDSNMVYLMPEGKTKEEIESKSKQVIEWCLKYNFNFSPRLQVLIYGDKRGV